MLIDTHAHLDMPEFSQDLDDVIQRAKDMGVGRIITIGIDFDSSQSALHIADTYNNVFASVGLHPHDSSKFTEEILEKLAALAKNSKVVAWGEIGLDFFKLYSPKEKQIEAFTRQLQVAREMGKPVIIHDREAHYEILDTLQKLGKGKNLGVIHCFSGDLDLALEFIKLGYFISIPGTVTYKNAHKTKQVAKEIPVDRLLVETDSPFLAPIPHRGKRNEPSYVAITAKEIAKLRGIGFDDLARATTKNAETLFGIHG